MHAVNANAFERVLRLSGPVGNGTAFTINVDDHQYLVTARHLLAEEGSTPVRVTNRFRNVEVDFVPLDVAPPVADIAITRLDHPVTSDLPLPPTGEGMMFSQDLYFLGFPYGLATQIAGGDPDNSIAFAKKAILSASSWVEDVHLYYLDGHNNPGFSGGPVVGFNHKTRQMQVIGVVSGYRHEMQPVYVGTAPVSEMAARANTGIVVATDIKHAVEAIG